MGNNTLNLANKYSNIFFKDFSLRFSEYFYSRINEKVFSPEKEIYNKLVSCNIDSSLIRRSPAFILKGDKEQICSDIISFSKPGDLLVLILKEDIDIIPVLTVAREMGLKTVVACHNTCLCENYSDLSFIYKEDSEIFALIDNITEAIGNTSNIKTDIPHPIEFCGASSGCFNFDINEEAFNEYKNANITHMEISFGRYEHTTDLNFKEYKRLADKYGITLWSFHLPFGPFNTLNIASDDETVRNFTVEYFMTLMKEAKGDAGITLFVVHPSGEPIHEDDRKMYMRQAKKSLYSLGDFAEQNGMTIAVENLPRTCLGKNSDDMLELLSAHPALKFCFDVNHSGSESAESFIKKLGNKIATVHISDYMGNDECHLMPGEGIINWTSLIRSLKNIGYKGPFMYEISKGNMEDGAIWAKESWRTKLFTRERFLEHKDIKENFESLMEKAK